MTPLSIYADVRRIAGANAEIVRQRPGTLARLGDTRYALAAGIYSPWEWP